MQLRTIQVHTPQRSPGSATIDAVIADEQAPILVMEQPGLSRCEGR